MHKAVSLAHEAISSHASTSSIASHEGKPKERASVVLALSCYGAILSPGQEYSGHYPPPYGRSSQASASSIDEELWIGEAEDNLEEWHLNRLKAFASNSEIWSKIKYIAFETLPVLYEGRAIRKAMTRLKRYLNESKGGRNKKEQIRLPEWWISFVFPNGELPSSTASLESGDITPRNIAMTIFKEDKLLLGLSDTNQEEVLLEIPNGIGINCTKMRYLPKIVKEYTSALQDLPLEQGQERVLVLYPDGGLVYDPNTKTWHQDGSAVSGEASNEGGDPAQIWASQLMQIAQDASKSGSKEKAWDSIILGGCCKASPAYIAELSKLVNEEGSR
jgi:homocysteine S-methyltransferase